MQAIRLPIVLIATLFVLPTAAAADSTESADCRLFGGPACRLTLTLSATVSSCDAAGCTFWVDCFYTISGTIAHAEGSCNGVAWALPCGTGSCSDGTPAGVVFVPRGHCVPVSASGVGHGLVVDSTPLVVVTSDVCV